MIPAPWCVMSLCQSRLFTAIAILKYFDQLSNEWLINNAGREAETPSLRRDERFITCTYYTLSHIFRFYPVKLLSSTARSYISRIAIAPR